MKKKILVLSASPRKNGNSDTLCDQFIKGAEDAGHLAHKIRIQEKAFNACLGCGVCTNSGICVHKDDMVEILEKMVQTDVIVFATPVYFYSMNGQLKQFIDRTYSRFREMKDKDFYFIITCGAPDRSFTETTLVGLRGFVRCVPGAKEKGIIYGVGGVASQAAIQEAFEMGKSIA